MSCTLIFGLIPSNDLSLLLPGIFFAFCYMKKSISKTDLGKIKKSRASYFPERHKEWGEEDHALDMLLTGVRIIRRGKENPLPMPVYLYGTGIKSYFTWIAGEILKKGNQEAADRLYYLAYFAVRFLQEACFKRPALFRPLAEQQLFWPSMVGRNADLERANNKLMEVLKLSAAAPLNTALKGRKSFTLFENCETQIAYNLWLVIESFRREEQYFSGEPVCSLVMPDLPGIHNPHKLGLTDEHIKKLKTLQPLSRQNYSEWWKLGEPAFINRYGKNFEKHKDFSRYQKNAAFKNDPKAKAKIRSAIKKQIKQAFRSIAPKSSTVR